MDDESAARDRTSLALNLIGLAGCIAAISASGGLALLAGIIGLGCLAGSVAISVFPSESPCERYFRECEEVEAPEPISEPAISHGQEMGESKRWQQGVAATRKCHRAR